VVGYDQPGVTAPIVGASKPHHLDDALEATTSMLDEVELKALEEPYRPHPVLGHDLMCRIGDRERPWTTCTRIDLSRTDRAGKNDKIFPDAGAGPCKRDLKTLEYHLLDAGHFTLETNGDEIAGLIREFLDKHMARK
jgi:pimeloyl-ACP methyl ester carboxylesterase